MNEHDPLGVAIDYTVEQLRAANARATRGWNRAATLRTALEEAYTLIGDTLLLSERGRGLVDADTRDALANWHDETGKLLGLGE